MNEREIDQLRWRDFALREAIGGARCVLWESRVTQRPDGKYAWNFKLLSPESTRREFGFVRTAPDTANNNDNETYHQRIPPEELARMDGVSHQALTRGEKGYQQEFMLIAADGTPRYMNEYVRIVVDGPGIWNLFGVQVDITERKRGEDEQRLRDEELRRVKSAEAVSQFAVGAAHYLSSLMSVIKGYSALMEKCIDNKEEQRNNIKMIQRAVSQSSNLKEQLLAMGQLERPETVPLDLNAIISETYTLLLPLIGGSLIDFHILLQPDLGKVLADRSQLELALINFSINARQAMPEGGSLIIETLNVAMERETALTGLRPGKYVKLMVTDTGVGMTEDVRARLFEPFYSTRGVARGTGLGLVSAQAMARRYGGDISVWSEPGKGTRFKMYLPRCDVD